MAYSYPSVVQIDYDDSGGTPQNITQYVLTINGVDVEQVIEEVHTLGDSWEEHLPVGIGKVGQIELGGLYSDDSNGPDDLFADRVPEAPSANARTLKITWRSGKTTTVETHLVKYSRQADRNALTKYTATLQPTGAVTEA